jgi:hypothetical protein
MFSGQEVLLQELRSHALVVSDGLVRVIRATIPDSPGQALACPSSAYGRASAVQGIDLSYDAPAWERLGLSEAVLTRSGRWGRISTANRHSCGRTAGAAGLARLSVTDATLQVIVRWSLLSSRQTSRLLSE